MPRHGCGAMARGPACSSRTCSDPAVSLPSPTVVHLDAVAARAPSRLAVHDGHGPVTYGEFHHRVVRCAQVLLALGFRPGDRAAIAAQAIGRELVLSLAVEGLGGVTASCAAAGDEAAPALYARVQWVLAAAPQAVPAGVRFVLVDDAFLRTLDQPLQGPAPAWAAPTPDAPVRLARTSGSSGPPKFLVHDRTALEWWIASAYTSCLLAQGQDSRLLVLCPLVVGGAYARAAACLRIGAAVLGGAHVDLAAMRPTA
ncbi:MAG: hypothetical protein EOO24_14960, partial [Comamonadaceae bacterium]